MTPQVNRLSAGSPTARTSLQRRGHRFKADLAVRASPSRCRRKSDSTETLGRRARWASRWTHLPLPLGLRDLSLIPEPAGLPQILEPAPLVRPTMARTEDPAQRLSDFLQHAKPPRLGQAGVSHRFHSRHRPCSRGDWGAPPPELGAPTQPVRPAVPTSRRHSAAHVSRPAPESDPTAAGRSSARRPRAPPWQLAPWQLTSLSGTTKAGCLVAGPTVLPPATRHKGQLSAGQSLPTSGPCWVRAASGTAGPRWARAVSVGWTTRAGCWRSPTRSG